MQRAGSVRPYGFPIGIEQNPQAKSSPLKPVVCRKNDTYAVGVGTDRPPPSCTHELNDIVVVSRATGLRFHPIGLRFAELVFQTEPTADPVETGRHQGCPNYGKCL